MFANTQDIADITESFEKLSPSPKKKKAKSDKVGAVFCQGGQNCSTTLSLGVTVILLTSAFTEEEINKNLIA